jgi:GNAT superfamily N-acetyltransferase
VVRPFQAEDGPALCALIEALADYESLTPPDSLARERLIRDALATPPRFWALLAESDSVVIGYAIFFETYSTFLAQPTLYLEDIFVLPQARRGGVGTVLFLACVAEAQRRGCGRMEWQALAWNDLADGFYQKLGARPIHEEWTLYRLLEEDLNRLLE